MRTKDNILKELGKNRQPGAYGGIPQDTRDYILIEVLIDIRDILDERLSSIDNTLLKCLFPKK